MKEEVLRIFNARLMNICIGLKEQSREQILNALLNHERKGSCVDRICDQIRRAEMACNIGGALKISRFRLLIEAGADMFANMALTHMKEQALSQAEKQRKIDQASKIENIKAEFEAEQKDLTDPRIVSFPGKAARRGIEL